MLDLSLPYEVTPTRWANHVLKLGLDDTSEPGEGERRLIFEGGDIYSLKVSKGGKWLSIGARFFDNENASSHNPYFEIGRESVTVMNQTVFVNFTNQFTTPPIVIPATSTYVVAAILTVSTSGFSFMVNNQPTTFSWIALGGRDAV